MEWEPIDDIDIDQIDNVDQNQMIGRMQWEEEPIDEVNRQEFDDDEQDQIDDYIQWDEDYQAYIYEILEEEQVAYISKLINNYTGGNYNNWNNWNEVNNEYKIEAYKIMKYEISRNISPKIEELRNINVYYNYLLFLANTLKNL